MERLYARSSGQGRPLCWLHGLTQTGRSFDALAAALSDRFCITTLDLPGHGLSPATADDVPACAQRVAEELDRPSTVLGYSLGGRVALRLALDHPQRVHALILIGAHPGLEDEAERAARLALDRRWALRLETAGLPVFIDEWLAQPMFAGLADPQRALRLGHDPAALARTIMALSLGAQAPLWSRLAELNMPVLLVTGALDTKFGAIAERMLGAIRQAEHVRIAGAGHAAHLEQPELFSRSLLAFLGRSQGSGASP